jgi:hypothetical protein
MFQETRNLSPKNAKSPLGGTLATYNRDKGNPGGGATGSRYTQSSLRARSLVRFNADSSSALRGMA